MFVMLRRVFWAALSLSLTFTVLLLFFAEEKERRSDKIDKSPTMQETKLCHSTQDKRKKHIVDVCKQLNITSTINEKFLRVDDEHKLLYCYIPKTGCTTWLNLMAEATSTGRHKRLKKPLDIHKPHYLKNVGLPLLSEYPEADKKNILSSYTKFTVVRHPITRLVSAYKDKMSLHPDVHPDYVMARWGVIRSMRPHATEQEIKQTQPTFQEFISRRLSPNWYHYNEKHWIPYHKLCNPCAMQFDYILKMEVMEQEMMPILKRLSSSNKTVEYLASLMVPHNKSPQKYDNVTSVRRKKMTDIPEMLNLTLNQRQEVEKMYELDSQLFGYKYNALTGEVDYGISKSECEVM